MISRDIGQLRADYLFDLAYHCHVSPNEVDDMKVLDFVRFIPGIDKVRANIQEHNRRIEQENGN